MSTTTSTGASPTPFVILYFLAIFLPPLAVFLDRGCGADFFINVCLTILAWIPGILHAWWIISKSERLNWTTNTGVPPTPVSTAAPATTPTPATMPAPATTTAPDTAAAKY